MQMRAEVAEMPLSLLLAAQAHMRRSAALLDCTGRGIFRAGERWS